MLKFVEDTHTYTFNGQVVPSVTTVLSAMGAGVDYGSIPASVLKRAADVGNAVHKIAEEFFLYRKPLLSPDDRVNMYLRGVRGFHESGVFEFLDAEKRMFCEKYWFAGTVDLVGWINGKFSVIDIKTTSSLHLDTVEYQLSLYSHLAEAFYQEKVEGMYALHLKGTKSGYSLVSLDKNPRARVEALRMVHNYNKGKGVY